MNRHVVIGASGLIGFSLYNALLSKRLDAQGTYTSQPTDGLVKFDLHDDCGFARVFDQIDENDFVYLLSAYSSPSWIADNKEITRQLNYVQTIKLIEYLIDRNPKIIFMSSVEVFDGSKGNYREDDHPNPINYYGELKYEVEEYLRNNYGNYLIVRTPWNIGLSNRSRCVVQLTYDTLLGGSARMATDNWFSVVSVADTVEAMIRCVRISDIDTIHVCSDAIVNRYELASFVSKVSERRDSMSFTSCRFEDIPYSEPRGRINDLENSLSKQALGMVYEDAYDLISKKVLFLDDR